jgi:hypothetical protein
MEPTVHSPSRQQLSSRVLKKTHFSNRNNQLSVTIVPISPKKESTGRFKVSTAIGKQSLQKAVSSIDGSSKMS